MPRHALHAVVSHVSSPTAGGVDSTQFSLAVRHMWSGLVLVAAAHGAARWATGDAGAIDVLLVTGAAALVAILWAPAVRDRQALSELGLALAVVMIVAAATSTAAQIAGHGNGAALLLLAWPLTLGAYFCSLRRALLLLGVAVAALGVRMLQHDRPVDGLQSLVAVLAVFGGMTPVVSMVRLRADLSVKYLHEAAIRDSLTGLLNRRGFEAAFGDVLDGAGPTERRAALVVANIDYFKSVNDTHGHSAGDQVLTEVSTIVFLQAPPDAIIARIGGEEFAMVLHDATLDDAVAMAERLRTAIEAAFGRTTTRITMSLGAVSTCAHGRDLAALMIQADHALQAAKALGRNRSVTYSEDVIEVLERARIRREEASRNQLATLLTLAEALDLRDASTAKHSRTVADYAEGMARELGLDADLVERIRLAGLLHDIGKIGVPDSVLLHPGKLDDEQWELMRQHPEIGARMLNHVDYTDIRDWVIAHHERVDGRGYPHGLEGDHIPLAARILAVADSYEAMTADRVYRASLGHEFARGELRTCAGSQFDLEVVEAMERYLDAEGIGLELEPIGELRPAAPMPDVSSAGDADDDAAIAA